MTTSKKTLIALGALVAIGASGALAYPLLKAKAIESSLVSLANNKEPGVFISDLKIDSSTYQSTKASFFLNYRSACSTDVVIQNPIKVELDSRNTSHKEGLALRLTSSQELSDLLGQPLEIIGVGSASPFGIKMDFQVPDLAQGRVSPSTLSISGRSFDKLKNATWVAQQVALDQNTGLVNAKVTLSDVDNKNLSASIGVEAESLVAMPIIQLDEFKLLAKGKKAGGDYSSSYSVAAKNAHTLYGTASDFSTEFIFKTAAGKEFASFVEKISSLCPQEGEDLTSVYLDEMISLQNSMKEQGFELGISKVKATWKNSTLEAGAKLSYKTQKDDSGKESSAKSTYLSAYLTADPEKIALKSTDMLKELELVEADYKGGVTTIKAEVKDAKLLVNGKPYESKLVETTLESTFKNIDNIGSIPR